MNLVRTVELLNTPYDIVAFFSNCLTRWIASQAVREWLIYAILCVPFLFMFYGSAIGFVLFTELQFRVLTVSFGFGCLYLLSTVLSVKLHEKSIRNFLSSANHLKPLHTDVAELIEEAYTRIWRKYVVKIIMTSMSIITTAVGPCLYEGNLKMYAMYVWPLCFMCDGNTTDSWFSFCFDAHTFGELILVNVVEFCVLIFGIAMQEWFSMLWELVQVILAAYTEDLCQHIESMSERVRCAVDTKKVRFNGMVRCGRLQRGSMEKEWNEKEEYDKLMYAEFRKIIVAHKAMYSLIKGMLPVISWMVSLVLYMWFTFGMLSTFIVFKRSKKQVFESFWNEVRFFCAVSGALDTILAHSIGGERFIEENERLINAVRNIPWYEQSTKFRRLVLVFLIQIQNPLEVKAFNVYKINFKFLVEGYKFCRSVLDFLLLKLKRY